MIKTFTIFFLTAISSFGQFMPNSVGVAYLNAETKDEYELTIVLPVQMLEKSVDNSRGDNVANEVVSVQSPITLFDANGELLSFKSSSRFTVQLWCDNGGGSQFRPMLIMSVKKNLLKRTIKGIPEIQNIACFVLINHQDTKVVDTKVPGSVVMEGDYNNDRKIDCFLWTYNDDAENCSGLPLNHLGVNLQLGGKHFSLRCCGP
jgi:hypothetical protein